DRHKVDIEYGKQPKVEEQNNIDAKPANEPPMVEGPKVDFRIQFTTERKFDDCEEMISRVCDLEYKLGFVVVIAKSDNEAIGRKGFVTLGCQRGGVYRKYVKILNKR
ncbi:FAR1-related protein, partial [Trifolium medium]|nr:FAR1-related protein [Trifolium medium]